MDVVFFSEIGFSFGEREHALSFARQIQSAGYRPHFVVADRVAEHVRSAGMAPIPFASPSEGVGLTREIDPALIVGCELYNSSNEVIAALAGMGCPIATMDGTTLGREINSDPFKGPGFQRTIEMPEHHHAFRACPVNDVGQDGDGVFHFSLFPGATRAPKDPELYRSLGLDPGRKTVLLAIAPWALNGARHAGLHRYHEGLLRRLVDGLRASEQVVQLLVVARGISGSEDAGRVTVRATDLLPHDVYHQVLDSCDAVVSDNIIQTSVSKAVVLGIPHLIVQSVSPARGSEPAHDAPPYPCNMFPLRHLFPPERDYAGVVDVAEYGKPAQIAEALAAILQRGYWDLARRERRAHYLARLEGTSTPAGILQKILGPADPTRAR